MASYAYRFVPLIAATPLATAFFFRTELPRWHAQQQERSFTPLLRLWSPPVGVPTNQRVVKSVDQAAEGIKHEKPKLDPPPPSIPPPQLFDDPVDLSVVVSWVSQQ